MPDSLNLGRKSRKSGRTEVIVDLPAGVRIFDIDQPCSRVYLLRKGRVLVSSDHGAIIEHLVPGDFFGEETLLPRRQRRQIARSLVPSTVSAFRVSQLLDRAQTDRRFARRLLRNLAYRLDRRGQAIGDFVAEPAERRLARLLSRLMPARPASGWVRLRFSLSNSQMARSIGTTRSRISHFIGHFRQLGWLQRRPELWVNREGLQEFLKTDQSRKS